MGVYLFHVVINSVGGGGILGSVKVVCVVVFVVKNGLFLVSWFGVLCFELV